MIYKLTRFVIIALICLASVTDAAPSSAIDRLLSDSLLAGASIGIEVHDINADSVRIEHESGKLFTPASNLKLFTSAAALERLGPGFRFKTKFYRRGEIDKKGKLAGDLVVVGGGDPLISGRFRNSVTEVLELWADSLKVYGIREIGGALVADNMLFKGSELGPGWSWDDLSYWYACQISALSFNDNCVDLKFFPGKKVGDPARIEIDPSTKYISITNNTITTPIDSNFTLDYYRSSDNNQVTFFGKISLSDSAGKVDYVSVNRPELYTLSIFSEVLQSKGVSFQHEIRALSGIKDDELYSKDKLKPLFTWHSDTLGVVLKVINTNSQNFFAEQTLRTLGVVEAGDGSFRGGIKAVYTFLDSLGITDRDIMMYDGSGLAYMNLVKPNAIIRLLTAMSKSRNFGVYLESLANPEKDRALRNRLKGIPGRGNVWAKTGYISGASTFSGYIKAPKSGHLLAFSIMINNYTCQNSYAESWEDSVIGTVLSEY